MQLTGRILHQFLKRTYQGRNIWDDPIIEKSQDQDQGQGQGQDQKLRQRSALQQQMVLALTLVLVLRFFNYRVVPDIPSLISSLEVVVVLVVVVVLPLWGILPSGEPPFGGSSQ